MHSPISMFDVKKVGTIACACICNGRGGRLLFERPWRVSTKKGGAVWTALDSKPWQYSVTRSLEKHSIMGLTAIRLHSDWTQIKHSIDIHCYSNVWRSICIAWRVFYHLGVIIIVLHSFLAQYFEPSIVYIFSFPVEIPLWQSYKYLKANNYVFSILWHQLRVLYPLLGVGSRVGWLHSWDNLRTTQFAPRCTRSER